MYLKEAYALYLESCEKDDDKCSFSTFCNFCPKNVLLLDESPKQQCKCQIHENLFLKLEAMGIYYEKDWSNTMLCNSTPNSDCWKNMCKECIDGKKIVPSKSLTSVFSYKQWEKVEVASHSKDTETYKKICTITKDFQVDEVVERFQEAFGRVKEHQNTKLIQAAEFETYKLPQKRVLQIDYAMGYQCELQNETMGALWTRGSVNLFTCAVYHNSDTKTFIFGTDYKRKDKFSTALFIGSLYHNHIFQDKDVAEDIIWSDGPSSEFKNQFICLLVQKLSSTYIKKI